MPKVLVPKVREFTAGRISVIIEVLYEISFTKKNNTGNKLENFTFFLVWISQHRGWFYWTLGETIHVVLWSALYVVAEAGAVPLYGSLGYGALIWRCCSKLKKKCLLCRYCVGCQGFLSVLKGACVWVKGSWSITSAKSIEPPSRSFLPVFRKMSWMIILSILWSWIWKNWSSAAKDVWNRSKEARS